MSKTAHWSCSASWSACSPLVCNGIDTNFGSSFLLRTPRARLARFRCQRKDRLIRSLLICSAVFLIAVPVARSGTRTSQPALVWKISKSVFGAHASTAFCIARYESHWSPGAISPGGGNFGVWQINVVHRSWLDWGRILDPWYNARAAYRLSRHGTDWSPWSTHRMCGV